MISEDTYFEMIVAAMNRSAMPGADVQWNVRLQGRQFDVVVTIPNGPYTLMLAVEVKNHKRRVEASNIEAFVTKGRDVNANKLIFVSANGFQSGCVDVAKRHGVDLFELTLGRSDDISFPVGSYVIHGASTAAPVMKVLPEEPGNAFEAVTIVYADGSRIAIPDESTQMRYYLEHTFAGTRNLLDVIAPDQVPTLANGATQTIRVPIGTMIDPPDEFFFRRGEARELVVEVRGVANPVMSGNVAFETTAISPAATYTNVISGSKSKARLVDLPFGPPEFEAGRFYFAYHPLRYIYCERVVDGIATIFLVESFQRGVLVRSSFDCDADCARFYIPVGAGSGKLRVRLEARLKALRELMAKPVRSQV
ncbi:hypothetical protein GOZ97_16535 [Agrobacterium vitis]|uniref:restriction endonuclease n=1 Tax=Rhizobium/Agrobacterium group TaxID=227290 RepID=UPI0012E85B47|nr:MULTISPECIES: restriction endonuclease [Rhizobium/Agrobacterium group]MCF1433197.1 hypothetical protein [Allorhizobium ampelinum]MUO91736.1 hypothetical protein [Agrobacterium vitis]MUZ54763.1 hypothetical protein [Agrobacterium vitis]MUZ93035.1 hypothetical protein [Agrobacterium vitis]MVA41443.1 hypothetical protein [Agrobacterium vitis]